MKKIAKVLMSITCLVLLTVFTTGCADKIDKKTLRQEQERLAEYTIQKYEDVQKIEFKSFEQDTSTRTWAADAIINDTYYITFSINKIGAPIIICIHPTKNIFFLIKASFSLSVKNLFSFMLLVF